MIINSLLIVADRGSLKAYRVEELPARTAPRLRLIQSFDVPDAHGRYRDKLTDQAGAFPAGGGGAGNQTLANSAAEHGGIDIENHRRAWKFLAERVNEVVREEKPEAWLFAASSQSLPVILEHLAPEVRERITQSVAADLVKTEPGRLPEHFAALRQG